MLAAWKEAGVEPPAEFLQAVREKDEGPELSFLDLQFLMVYQEAASCRPFTGMGGGLLPIPFTAIDRVAGRFGFGRDEFLTLLWIIRTIDNEVLEIYANQDKNRSSGS